MSYAGPLLWRLRSWSPKMLSGVEYVSELGREDEEGWLERLLLAAAENDSELGVSKPPA
jgi:hypothetical protein